MEDQTILILLVVGAVALLGYWVATMFFGKQNDELRRRLHADVSSSHGSHSSNTAASQPRDESKTLLNRLGEAAAEPFMPKERNERQSTLRREFTRAGIYAPQAVRVIFGARFLMLIVGLIVGAIVGTMTEYTMLSIAGCALFGYMAPKLWLSLMVRKNQRELTHGLPDALDLMVVCVEAGLTIDAAMQRVGQELSLAHPSVSRELGISHMETRVGIPRGEALKNLGTRTGNNALQSLAAMLVQADRFGTSIAQALRIHAESLRATRQHQAEEMAAKASVKMTFPLVLFIFPATFIVLMGPMMIDLMNGPLFN